VRKIETGSRHVLEMPNSRQGENLAQATLSVARRHKSFKPTADKIAGIGRCAVDHKSLAMPVGSLRHQASSAAMAFCMAGRSERLLQSAGQPSHASAVRGFRAWKCGMTCWPKRRRVCSTSWCCAGPTAHSRMTSSMPRAPRLRRSNGKGNLILPCH
jgi:hypothetical protein